MARKHEIISISIHPRITTFKKIENKINQLEELLSDIGDEVVLSKEHGRNHKKPTHLQIGLSLRKPTRVDNVRRKFMGWLKASDIQISDDEKKKGFKFKAHKNKARLFMYCLKERPEYYYIKSLGGVMNSEYLEQFINDYMPYALEYGLYKKTNQRNKYVEVGTSLMSFDEYAYNEWLRDNPNDPVYTELKK